jgi:hypothetical protein
MNVLLFQTSNIDYTARILEQRRIYHALPTGARGGRENGFFMDPCLLHAGIRERQFTSPFI